MSESSSGPPEPAGAARVPDPGRWKALVLLCAAYFMITVDSQIVILALPSIQADLGFTATGAQWVMSAYLLSFGGLLLFGGRTADLLGGRRMFMVGTLLFLVASLFCGLAWTSGILVGARIAQGVAGAIMAPTAMAVLMNTFSEGHERNRAVGIWAGIGAFGATAALLLGGPLTQGLGWEWIFFINIPVALAVLLIGPKLLRETPISKGKRSFDPLGAITITGALVMVVYAAVDAPAIGWGHGRTLGMFGGAIVLLILFLIVEKRSSAPLVPLQIFRSRAFVSGNVMTLLAAMTTFGGAIMMSVYAQEVLGYSAVLFGASTAVYAAMSVVGSNVAGPLTTRVGYKKVAVAGALMLTVGTLLLSMAPADGSYWADLFPGMLFFGTGIGTTSVAAAIGALSGAAPNEAGLAAGVNNSMFQIGGALGVALCVTVSVAAADPSAADARVGLNAGVQAAFTAACVVGVTCLVVALALNLLPERKGAPPVPDRAPAMTD
uniref:MFS transporter n=1 Tax=Nonomuraea bangladeshensis TaxID=404385 RepID=UPI003F494E2D